ncbi:MAG: hypothetical protein J6S67_09990 [Methanobrevibacter sp.]|nr:hypothetical protein [Methanobrevibacter sp.]
MLTWALDNNSWDIGVDPDTKSIALKDGNDQVAQDVCSSVRVWQGELPMDEERGIAYGKPEELRGVLNFEMRDQAKLIDDVADASVVFNKLENRELDATIYVTTNEGETIEVR